MIDELITEFPDWLETRKIGEPTHEGREIEIIQFKEKASHEASVLIDGAHHSRELVTIKMTFSVLLRLLHGVHWGDKYTLDLLERT